MNTGSPTPAYSLADMLAHWGHFSPGDIDLFEAHSYQRRIARHECLLQPGEPVRSFYFVEAGALYQYEASDELGEDILNLHTPGQWCVVWPPAQGEQITTYLRAYTDGRLRQMDFAGLHYCIGRSQAFLQLARLADVATAPLRLRASNQSPAEKYESLFDQQPALWQYFPLRFIASYMGMAPETLSRVRAAISRRKPIS